MTWFQFTISAAVIVFAGIRLTTYADELSDKLQLGKVWLGIVLLGFVTSLPEAITSIAAVVSLKANDLAVGNMLGSNNFNPILIVVMDLVYRKGSITNDIESKKSHDASGIFAIVLTLIVTLEILINPRNMILHLGPLSVGSILIVLVYFGAMKYLAQIGSQDETHDLSQGQSHEPLGTVYLNLIFSAGLVVVAAIFLTKSADAIATQTGLGRTFVGSIFLAFVTSLPEMVVSLSALRLGSLDLAVGNIFGSNMTNMLIVSLCSLFYRGQGLFLETVAPIHVFTGLLSVTLVAIIIGSIHKQKKTICNVGIDSIVMLLVFVVGLFVLYWFR